MDAELGKPIIQEQVVQKLITGHFSDIGAVVAEFGSPAHLNMLHSRLRLDNRLRLEAHQPSLLPGSKRCSEADDAGSLPEKSHKLTLECPCGAHFEKQV